MLPSFIVIGAAKCGTTSMCELLGQHPDVFLTNPKEPHFFSRITTFEHSRPWYESLFRDAGGHRAVGEGSTSYTHPHRIDLVVPRLRREVPACRLIYMVRHPVRRLESDWKMRTLERRLSLPISQALDRNASLVTLGFYHARLSAYRAAFSDEQILVVFLEDLQRDPEHELARVFRHIGVDTDFIPEGLHRPHNTAEERARSVVAERIVRRVPAAQRMARRLPSGLRRIVKQGLSWSVPEEPTVKWEPRVLQSVTDLFRDDSLQLLDHCGKSHDFWDFAENPESAAGSIARA